MNITNAEKWVILQFSGNTEPHYKVFATWHGGYLHGDSWKMNSGICQVEETQETWKFHGHSGSKYHCPKNQYGITTYGATILNNFIQKAKKQKVKIKILPSNTEWKKLEIPTRNPCLNKDPAEK